MTEHATPAVTHEDGVQNGPFVSFLAQRIPAGLGGLIFTVLAVLVFCAWAWSLGATWAGHAGWGLPLFQVTIVAGVVVTVAYFARKTLAWLLPLVAGALWLFVSMLPLLAFWQVLLQAATVTALIWATVFAVVAANHAEKPRF